VTFYLIRRLVMKLKRPDVLPADQLAAVPGPDQPAAHVPMRAVDQVRGHGPACAGHEVLVTAWDQ
jgi:hypothetical protein